jgi:RNA polymerase sigma-54 factor
MVLEIKQNLKLTQQLVMTPQLQQAIKLLQLSRLELLELIRQEIKENPMLEEKPEAQSEKTVSETQLTEEFGYAGSGSNNSKKESTQDKDFDWNSYLYHEAKAPWDPLPSAEEDDDSDEGRQFIERSPDVKGGLENNLLEQLTFSALDPEEKRCGELIIGNLDDNGYLIASLEELSSLTGLSKAKVESVLKAVQRFEPPGVAARDLQECLMLQLPALKVKARALVEKLLSHHLANLASKKYSVIAKNLNVSREEIIEAVKIINSLDPKPGRAFSLEAPQYINPDIYVYKIEGEYVVILNEDGLPKLHINSFYRQILSDKNCIAEESKAYIQNKLRSAVWLIKSIYHRQNTLRNVMHSIIRFQTDFFEKGIGYLKPLVLREIAEDINVHESTVGRVTNNKYVHTPHGIFELKFFFNSHIKALDGDDIASESVKDMIRRIVSTEDPQAPHSDQKIVEMLRGKNVNIARRTVTKYREMMSLLPSNKRKQLL